MTTCDQHELADRSEDEGNDGSDIAEDEDDEPTPVATSSNGRKRPTPATVGRRLTSQLRLSSKNSSESLN